MKMKLNNLNKIFVIKICRFKNKNKKQINLILNRIKNNKNMMNYA